MDVSLYIRDFVEDPATPMHQQIEGAAVWPVTPGHGDLWESTIPSTE